MTKERCRWCDAADQEINNHCRGCYPVWRAEYKRAWLYKDRAEKAGSALRYATLHRINMILQGYQERLPDD